MFNYNNYLIQEERPTWRSAHEIEIAALKYEKLRIQMMNEDASPITQQAQIQGGRNAGFWFFLKAPLRMLAALIE